MRLGGELDAAGQSRRLSHLCEIFLHRHIRTEMEEVLETVAVNVPHAVEITGGEPVGIEDLLGFGATDAVEQQALELVVGESVLCTRTDVIVVVPELSRYFRTAYALQQTPAVFDRSPFQHAADGDVEHDGVVVLEDGGVQDTRLTQTRPLFDARVGDDAFRERFGETVVVVRRHTYRIACASPVQRFATVTHLRYRTDIDHFRLLVFGLRQDGFGDILRSGDIRAQRGFWTIVRLRRNHAAYVQHDVGTRDALQDVLVVGEVSPYDV